MKKENPAVLFKRLKKNFFLKVHTMLAKESVRNVARRIFVVLFIFQHLGQFQKKPIIGTFFHFLGDSALLFLPTIAFLFLFLLLFFSFSTVLSSSSWHCGRKREQRANEKREEKGGEGDY